MAAEIQLAETIKDADEAYALAKSIFLDGSNSAAEELKILSWDQAIPPFLMIAKDGQRIVGLARVCPTFMQWKSRSFRVAGLSSICVDPNYRGKGLGRKIMDATVQFCDREEFDFTYLIARKKADYFYQKFDYIGASSYPKITISEYSSQKSALTKPIKGIELRPFNPKHANQYHGFYSCNYTYCFGATLRPVSVWENIAKRALLMGLTFHEIWHHSVLVGYGIADDHEIVEYAVNLDWPDHLVAASFGFLIKDQQSIELSIPHHHRVVQKLTDHDLIFTSRRCLYGGHMIRWNKYSTTKIEYNIGTTNPATSPLPFFAINRLDEV